MSLVKIALHLPTNKYLHINNASNGISCECICIKCKDKLEAIQGEIRDKHFRHSNHENCEGAQETALHLLAKQIIAENSKIMIPGKGMVIYHNPLIEKEVGAYRSDVGALYNNENIFFEVVVTNSVEADKKKFFIENKCKSVEIHLNSNEISSYDEIRERVLNSTDNKNLIFWEKLQPEENNNGIIIFVITIIGVVASFLYFVFGRNKKNQKIRGTRRV